MDYVSVNWGIYDEISLCSKGEQIHQVSKLNFTRLVTVNIIFIQDKNIKLTKLYFDAYKKHSSIS